MSVFSAQATGAEESFRPWAIGLTLQTDEAQSESLYTTFNWGVAENTWLFFAAGQSKSPVGRADIKTKDLSAGVDHNFALLGVSFEVEQWGEKDAVESFDYRGSVYLRGDRYSVGFDLKRRDIDLTFSIPGPGGQADSSPD